MRITYLGKAAKDLQWLHIYYTHRFPEGRDRAWRRIQNGLRLIIANPAIGKPFGSSMRRRYVVPNTPFVIYYQFRMDRLEIARVWDTRRNLDHLSFDKTES